MERVKDISKIKMVDGTVLIQIHLKESKIIMPDSTGEQDRTDYAQVVEVTDSITDLKKGDIVLEFNSSSGFEWEKFTFAVVPRHAIKIAVDKTNFDFNKSKDAK